MANEIIIKPLLSEKSEMLTEKRNQFSFVVARKANKITIGKEIERIYGVQVEAVNTMVMPGKIKMKNTRGGMVKGRQSSFKKAIVTVAEGETIDLYGEV
jgi:large subunit ribosomal protein L23